MEEAETLGEGVEDEFPKNDHVWRGGSSKWEEKTSGQSQVKLKQKLLFRRLLTWLKPLT